MVDAGQVVASLELDAENFMGGMNAAIQAAQALGGGATDASKDIARLTSAMGALEGAAESGASGAAEALSSLRAAGREAVNGLIAGAEDRRGALAAAFRSLARSAIQAARREMGIASPSKVFAQIGRYAVAGFVQGIDQGAGSAQASMRRLVSADALTQPGAAAGVVNNHYAAPVTVTFPNASVRSDSDILELERRTQRIARDLQYGLGVR